MRARSFACPRWLFFTFQFVSIHKIGHEIALATNWRAGRCHLSQDHVSAVRKVDEIADFGRAMCTGQRYRLFVDPAAAKPQSDPYVFHPGVTPVSIRARNIAVNAFLDPQRLGRDFVPEVPPAEGLPFPAQTCWILGTWRAPQGISRLPLLESGCGGFPHILSSDEVFGRDT